MNVSRITLVFQGENDNFENNFISYYYKKFFKQIMISQWLGAVLLASFSLLDIMLIPSNFMPFLFIRIIIVGTMLISILISSFESYYEKFYLKTQFIGSQIISVGIVIMIIIAPSHVQETYHAGLIMIFMYLYVLSKMRFIYATISCWNVFLVYILAGLISNMSQTVFLTNIFVCFGVNMIGMFINYSIEYAERKNYYLTHQILEEQKKVNTMNITLTEEKAKIELIIDTISDGVLVVDNNGTITMVNKAFTEIYQHVVEKKFPIGINLIHGDDDPIIVPIKELFIQKKNKLITAEIVPDLFLQFEIAFDNKTKNHFKAIIEVRDISSLVKFDKMKKQFTSVASHELITPITAIKQSINNYLKYNHKLDEEKKNYLLYAIDRNADMMQLLIKDLLILSRIDEGKTTIETSMFSPKEIVLQAISQLEFKIKERKISIKVDIDNNLILIGDITKISQIFRIFIDNAIKYSKSSSEVKIMALRKINLISDNKENPKGIEGILFYIIDSGCGIPKKDLTYLFRRFFRSDNVHNINGIGLGLSIAKELIHLHKGKVSIDSELGVGTCINIFLPLGDVGNKKYYKED